MNAATHAAGRPAEALVGLLALVHCLSAEEIRFLRLADVLAPDRLRVCGREASYRQGAANGSPEAGGSRQGRDVELAPPVAAALARYLSWRRLMYGGPSSYLLVSRASRLHDRPVSASWLHVNLLPGTPVASLRQSAIQRLIQDVGCDGLQLAAYTARSLQTVQIYLHVFHRPAPSEHERECEDDS